MNYNGHALQVFTALPSSVLDNMQGQQISVIKNGKCFAVMTTDMLN